MRLTAFLSLLTFFIAVALGVTLYALTRDQDGDLAVLALCCRATEGVIGATAAASTLDLLSVATASTATPAPDAAAVQALGGLMLHQGDSGTIIAATCFAVGSTLFSYLFLRARSIPVSLAWLGVLASLLLVVGSPPPAARFPSRAGELLRMDSDGCLRGHAGAMVAHQGSHLATG